MHTIRLHNNRHCHVPSTGQRVYYRRKDNAPPALRAPSEQAAVERQEPVADACRDRDGQILQVVVPMPVATAPHTVHVGTHIVVDSMEPAVAHTEGANGDKADGRMS